MWDGSTVLLLTQPLALGVSDTVARGSMTNEAHILLWCTDFMLEFKRGEKGSCPLVPAKEVFRGHGGDQVCPRCFQRAPCFIARTEISRVSVRFQRGKIPAPFYRGREVSLRIQRSQQPAKRSCHSGAVDGSRARGWTRVQSGGRGAPEETDTVSGVNRLCTRKALLKCC